jgi:hypothetical protein
MWPQGVFMEGLILTKFIQKIIVQADLFLLVHMIHWFPLIFLMELMEEELLH